MNLSSSASRWGLSQRALGIVEVLLSGVCFGFLGFFGKKAFAKGISPGEFLAYRYSSAALMMAVLIALKTRSMRTLWLGHRTVIRSLLLGVCGYAVFSSFYFFALERISASMTVILLYLYPLLVALGGRVLFNERIPGRQFWAFPLAFVGLILLVWADAVEGDSLGVALGFCSALFYSAYILLSSKWLKGVDPFISTFWIQLGAGLTLFCVHFGFVHPAPFGWGLVSGRLLSVWTDVLLIGFVCSVLAMSLFLSGLLKIKNWEASLLSMAEPIVGVLVGVLILGDVLTPSQWIGICLVLIALAIVSWPRSFAHPGARFSIREQIRSRRE